MKRTIRQSASQCGFTMMEIIAVLVIIGIIAVVAVSLMSSTTAYDLPSQVEVVKNHLRYAQIRAMNTDTIWGINFNSATTYYLFQGIGSTTPVQIPGENGATINLAAKKSSLTITPPTGGVVAFDSYGRPLNNSGTLLTADVTVATTGGNITVTKNTGFIP
jgi:prepilin-type N-terminal cleavage/methylation domain-containing protein